MKRPLRLYRTSSSGMPLDSHQPLLSAIRNRKIEFRAIGRSHYPGDRLAPRELPGLLSLGQWDARGEHDWGMDLHRNEGLEITLLETGSMKFAVDQNVQAITPGCLTITRPWQVHRQGEPHIAASRLHWSLIDIGAERPDQNWRWPGWLVLSAADRGELERRLRQTRQSVWKASPDVLRSFGRLSLALDQTNPSRRLSAVAVGLNELLLGVLELLSTENEPERSTLSSREYAVELFLADLAHNLSSLEKIWTLASMAEACGMGTTLFSRLCRRLTNDSPLRHLNRARLDAAASLLESDPTRSVTAVAFDCGFQSSQYFAHQFYRRFGKSPSDFRRERTKR